tara:strand:- start:1578 stop:2651 length:1074 start_codon:yes stop_codon:yes gene_type:complete
MKQKKIVISTYTFLPDIGGVATNSLTIAEAFIAKGYDVTVVTLTGEKSDYDGKIKVVRKPNLFTLMKLYFYADWILYSNLSVKLCWPAIFLHKTSALHHHSSSAFSRSNVSGMSGYMKRYVENKVISKSIHFVNSEFTKTDAGCFFDKRQAHITYPIVQKTKISERIVNKYKERNGAIFVGRIEKEKGVSYLLENINLIKEKLNVKEITFVGDGTLLETIKENKPNGTNFVGAVDLNRVHELMEKSEYVFVPSIWQEPFGIVAVEGLASGAIVISSDRGGLPEALGDLGELFDFDSTNSFEDALKNAKIKKEKLLGKQSLLEYIESVNIHMEKFSSSKVIQVIINALTDEDKKRLKC